MAGDPTARLIDLTRLVSRLGKGPLTGVDRVELAYLDHLMQGPRPLFALVQSAWGFLLLDRHGAAAVAEMARGRPAGPRDWIAVFSRRKDRTRGRTEATLRRQALAQCLPAGLLRMLRRHLPEATSYLNVGHSNLTERVLAAVRALPGARIVVLVHDVIPLDYPEFARSDIPPVFARKMAAVSAHADLVIHSTEDSRQRTEARLAEMGRVPPSVVAALGIDIAPADVAALPEGLDLARPYFLTIGTIEPRKNHGLLLDVWERLAERHGAETLPQLLIVGGRGWANETVFRRLDARPPGVTVLSGLGDGAVTALLAGARALLFPSHAEGFGLPPMEAMALGTPVVASPLPVFRELMCDYPVYLDATDSYSWVETIDRMTKAEWSRGEDRPRTGANRVPDWGSHFNKVLSLA